MSAFTTPPLLSDYLQELLRNHASDEDPRGDLWDDFRHGLSEYIRNSTAKMNELNAKVEQLEGSLARAQAESAVMKSLLLDLRGEVDALQKQASSRQE